MKIEWGKMLKGEMDDGAPYLRRDSIDREWSITEMTECVHEELRFWFYNYRLCLGAHGKNAEYAIDNFIKSLKENIEYSQNILDEMKEGVDA